MDRERRLWVWEKMRGSRERGWLGSVGRRGLGEILRKLLEWVGDE